MPGTHKQNSMFKKTRGYVQDEHPFAVTSCGRRRNDGSPLLISEASYNKQNRKMRKENPGSKLKTAVTGKVKPGSKAAGRRKSFCARSKGWTGERGKAARRRWKC